MVKGESRMGKVHDNDILERGMLSIERLYGHAREIAVVHTHDGLEEQSRLL